MAARFRKGQRVRIKDTGEVGTVARTYTIMGDQTVEFDYPNNTTRDIYSMALERISEEEFQTAIQTASTTTND